MLVRPPRDQAKTAGRFNEAGADCPGMRRHVPAIAPGAMCFNEAGADCPGMPIQFGKRLVDQVPLQ